jgi:hypothetical protein
MEDKTTELFRANADILTLLHLIDEIGWQSVREQSIQRILYLSKVLYSFVNTDNLNPFVDYHFSANVSGPYSDLINRSLVDLKSRELISEDEEGKIKLTDEQFKFEYDENQEKWLKTIVYILGLYGESKIYGFTIKDPLYKSAIETQSEKELDTSPENITITVLNDFKNAFEETLDEETLKSINQEEYLELYFEYVFSKIIERKNSYDS